MIERFTSVGYGNSLEEVVKAFESSRFDFRIKTVTYITTITYSSTRGYTYNIFVERTSNTIYFNTLTTKEKLIDDIKEQLVSLGFKNDDTIEVNTKDICDFVLDNNDVDFDNIDPGTVIREKLKRTQSSNSPSKIIEGYLNSKKLDQEQIEILKTHDIINGLGGKGGIRIKDLLIPIIKKLKAEYKEEYLSKLRLIEHYSYYHDLDYYIGGGESEFFQSNLNFCIQVKRVIPSYFFFMLLLGILTVRGRKYFQFKE